MDEHQNETANNQAPAQIRYAGFGIRFGANLIDFLIFVPLVVLNFYNILNMKSLVIALVVLTITMIYKPAMEYVYQATLGKMAVGIKVVDYDYDRIDLTQAILRYFPWLITNAFSYVVTIIMFGDNRFNEVSDFMQYGEYAKTLEINSYNQWIWLIILLSAIVMLFNAKKQAAHDMIAGTYCIYKK